jgi:hypothetical protein
MADLRNRYLLSIAFCPSSWKNLQNPRYLYRTARLHTAESLGSGCMQVVKDLDSAASAGWLQYKLAKTMQALAARTTSSYSCTARFCPECHHSLRQSDTIDPRHAKYSCFELCNCVVFVGYLLPRTCFFNTVTRHTDNCFRSRLPTHATSDKHCSLPYVHIDIASMPLGTAGTMLVYPLRGARHRELAATEIDRSHCHPNLATYETKDLLGRLCSCLIGS